MQRWIPAVLALSVTATGCLTEQNFRSEALPRAAFDLSCRADQVVVTPLGDGSFGASGCGRKATYVYLPRVGYVNNSGVQSDGTRPSTPRVTYNETTVRSVEPPPADQFVVVPLHVVLLRGQGDASTAFASELPNIVKQLNHIFVLSGVYFNLDGPPENVEVPGNLPFDHASLASLVPAASEVRGFRLFIVRDMDVNGAVLRANDIVVKESPGLKLVPGPAVNTVARVTAHVLGRALGLKVSRYPSMLMALGTTGSLLDATETNALKAAAKQVQGAKTFDEFVRSGASPETIIDLRSHAAAIR